MDKFELKEMLIESLEKLNEIHSKLMSKSTDEETGEIRVKVIREIYRVEEKINRVIHVIY